MRVFFPIEEAGGDDLPALLVPYRCGLACAGTLRRQLGEFEVEFEVVSEGEGEGYPAGMPAVPAADFRDGRSRRSGAVLSG